MTYAGQVQLAGKVYNQIAVGKVLGKQMTVFTPVRTSTSDCSPADYRIRWNGKTHSFKHGDLTAREHEAYRVAMQDGTAEKWAFFLQTVPFSWFLS